MKIAVWFSSGVASAIATMMTIKKYGNEHEIIVLNNPIKEEHEDNRRFLKDIENWLGIEIEIVTNSKYPSCSAVDVWNDRKFMSSPKGAPCTQQLKKVARQQWEANNNVDFHVLGFTFDEKSRHERFVLTERENVLPVLIEEGITKADCYKILKDAGINPPITYFQGFPNGNCLGCPKATSPTYWNHLRTFYPKVFEERAIQSREIGARLVRVNGNRIFLDKLDPNAKGRPMKNMDFECGIFCEETE